MIEVTGERAEELRGAGGESLVGRAAHAWASVAGVGAPRARILVDKRIPVAAGLGGGSADAAAAILALDELFGTGLDPEALLEVAAAVGSDVCALVSGGPVFADGRGDHVLPLHAPTSHWVVRALPFAVRTPDAYGWWDERPASGPDPGSLIAAIEVGDHDLAGSALFDDLQPGVAARHPEVERADRRRARSRPGPRRCDRVGGPRLVRDDRAPAGASPAYDCRAFRGRLTARRGPLEPEMEVRPLPPEPRSGCRRGVHPRPCGPLAGTTRWPRRRPHDPDRSPR